MDELIKHEGKLVYKRKGLFAGLTGRLEKNNTGLTSHTIVYDNWSNVAVSSISEIIVVGEENANSGL